jgi:hypothetical protein
LKAYLCYSPPFLLQGILKNTNNVQAYGLTTTSALDVQESNTAPQFSPALLWRRSKWLSKVKLELASIDYQKSPQTIRFKISSQKLDICYF